MTRATDIEVHCMSTESGNIGGWVVSPLAKNQEPQSLESETLT